MYVPVPASWVVYLTKEKISICSQRSTARRSERMHEMTPKSHKDALDDIDNGRHIEHDHVWEFVSAICEAYFTRKVTDVCVTARNARYMFHACIVAGILITILSGTNDPMVCPHLTLVDTEFTAKDATERSKGYQLRRWACGQDCVSAASLLYDRGTGPVVDQTVLANAMRISLLHESTP